MADLPHVLLPFRFDNNSGDVVAVEQDSETEIMQCVEVICEYIKGDREERPDFGITDQAFAERGINLEMFRKEVITLEPRAPLLFEVDTDWIALAERIGIILDRSEGNVV